MPDWQRVVNAWNPITFVIEAMRSLMTTGYDCLRSAGRS